MTVPLQYRHDRAVGLHDGPLTWRVTLDPLRVPETAAAATFLRRSNSACCPRAPIGASSRGFTTHRPVSPGLVRHRHVDVDSISFLSSASRCDYSVSIQSARVRVWSLPQPRRCGPTPTPCARTTKRGPFA